MLPVATFADLVYTLGKSQVIPSRPCNTGSQLLQNYKNYYQPSRQSTTFGHWEECVLDNYYSSPQLLEEMFYRQTYTCGTVISNCKYLPEAAIKPAWSLESLFSDIMVQ